MIKIVIIIILKLNRGSTGTKIKNIIIIILFQVELSF